MSREQLASRVDDIIAFAQLERFADNPVKTYSSGMYARLGFAIAVNVDPDVLLVDEVLAVGDESFRSRCYERMLAFREAGKTLILVTHDLGAIASFCSRAIWLDEGKIRGEDTPEAITRRYVAEVTAQEELWSAQQAAAGRGLVTFHQPINDTVPISLTSMSIAAEDGTERDVFHNGEAIRIRTHYTARQPGALADRRGRAAPPRRHARDAARRRAPAGSIRATCSRARATSSGTIADLRLTPGSYYLSPKLIDQTGLHVLDEQERWYRFQVRAGDYLETEGAAILPVDLVARAHARRGAGDRPSTPGVCILRAVARVSGSCSTSRGRPSTCDSSSCERSGTASSSASDVSATEPKSAHQQRRRCRRRSAAAPRCARGPCETRPRERCLPRS